MIVSKNFKLINVLRFSGIQLFRISAWMIFVTIVYELTDLHWLVIPWLPLSIIGTAVAFYLGFKNNSAYSRMWEARKIWGGIVNSSRAWGSVTRSFIENLDNGSVSEEEIATIKRRLIYRQIGWTYALRSQLLKTTPWEHANQSGIVGKKANTYIKEFGIGLVDDEVTKTELHHYLPKEEYEELINYRNTATQILDRQSEEISELTRKGLLNDFRLVELQRIINELYIHQGKYERIKKFPLPRLYASMGSMFVSIFIALLPFGMVSEFSQLGEDTVWFAVPFTILVGWIFSIMELVGDYSENPFQGWANDIPMLSLCRTIEIDLKEMLREKDLPNEIEAQRGILM